MNPYELLSEEMIIIIRSLFDIDIFIHISTRNTDTAVNYSYLQEEKEE